MTRPPDPIVIATLDYLAYTRQAIRDANPDQLRHLADGLADLVERLLAEHHEDTRDNVPAGRLVVPAVGAHAWCAGHRAQYHPCDTYRLVAVLLGRLLTWGSIHRSDCG